MVERCRASDNPEWIEDAARQIASHVSREYPNIGAPMQEKFVEIIAACYRAAPTAFDKLSQRVRREE